MASDFGGDCTQAFAARSVSVEPINETIWPRPPQVTLSRVRFGGDRVQLMLSDGPDLETVIAVAQDGRWRVVSRGPASFWPAE